MEDKGKMDELIEQMKLMNVLLSKHDKREETKEESKSWFGKKVVPFLFLIWVLALWFGTTPPSSFQSDVDAIYKLGRLDERSHQEGFTPSMNDPSSHHNKHSLLHANVVENVAEERNLE